MTKLGETAEFELDLDPIDWEQLELLARLTPAERALAMMRAQAFVMAGIRGAFARRIRRTFADETGAQVRAWCARPEDVIFGKLKAWNEGHSAKHPADVREMLAFALSGLGDEPIDLDDLTSQAIKAGGSVLDLWTQLQEQAIADTQGRSGDVATKGK